MPDNNDKRRSAAEDDFGFLSEFVKRLGLDDEESDKFISSSMTRLGHKRRIMWEDGESDGNSDDGGDFFSTKRRERGAQRPVGGGGDRRASGGGGGMFGGTY